MGDNNPGNNAWKIYQEAARDGQTIKVDGNYQLSVLSHSLAGNILLEKASYSVICSICFDFIRYIVWMLGYMLLFYKYIDKVDEK